VKTQEGRFVACSRACNPVFRVRAGRTHLVIALR
jgi:hypothetical protein